MINKTASGIFGKNVLGGKDEEEYDDPSQSYNEQQQRAIGNDGVLNALRPINFNDKIMGGQRINAFMAGKMPALDGSFAYTQRVKMLTGKGANKMKDGLKRQYNTNVILGEDSSMNKINIMTKGFGGNTLNKNKINLLASSKSKSAIISSLLGTESSNKNKISKMLGSNKGKHDINTINRFLKNTNGSKDNISKLLGIGHKNKTTNPFINSKSNIKQSKQSAINKIKSSFGVLHNSNNSNINFNKLINGNNGSHKFTNNIKDLIGKPEKSAKHRMKQQNGLSMFGDYDGDKVLNMFDCDPINPKKQGKVHDFLNKLKYGVAGNVAGNDIVNVAPIGKEQDTGIDNWNPGIDSNERYLGNDGNVIESYSAQQDDDIYGAGDVVKSYDDNNYNDMNNNVNSFSINNAEQQVFASKNTNNDAYIPNNIINNNQNNTFEQLSSVINDTDMNINNEDAKQTDNYISSDDNIDMENINNQIKAVREKLASKDTTDKERNGLIKLYQELVRTARGDKDISLKNKKYTDEQLEKVKENERKIKQARMELNFRNKKFDAEFGLSQKQFDENIKNKTFIQERQAKLDEQKNKLDVAKFKQGKSTNNVAMWDAKLKSASNTMKSIMGAGNSLDGFNNVIGRLNKTNSTGQGVSMMSQLSNKKNAQGLKTMSGAGNNNPQNFMLMSGALNQSPSIRDKVYDSVNLNNQSRDWSQVVNESVGRQSAEDIIAAEQQRELQNQMNQANAQIENSRSQQMSQMGIQNSQPQNIPPMRQQVFPQQNYRQPVQQGGYGRQEVNWNNVSPQQAAQYDAEYAQYMSESADENVYRRGPYKKRRF